MPTGFKIFAVTVALALATIATATLADISYHVIQCWPSVLAQDTFNIPSEPRTPSFGKNKAYPQSSINSSQSLTSAYKNESELNLSIMASLLDAEGSGNKISADSARQKETSSADWWARYSALGSILSGIFTFCLFITSAIQVCLFQHQLNIMRNGLNDTRTTAVAARDTAEAAVKANAINREQFMAGRRAWLSVERIALKAKTKITSHQATFFMEITIKNFGDTPATSVMINLKTVPAGGAGNSYNVLAHECKIEAAEYPVPSGVTIFPGKTHTFHRGWATEAGTDESFTRLIKSKSSACVIFPLAVSYTIDGSTTRRITYIGYNLTMFMPAIIDEGNELILAPGSEIGIDDIT